MLDLYPFLRCVGGGLNTLMLSIHVALRRYERINNPSMRMEHKAGDKLFVYYTGAKCRFEQFGEHDGVTIYPTRAHRPKDKAHVENAVKLTHKDIFTVIEPLHCPDLRSLNVTIRDALEKHNN